MMSARALRPGIATALVATGSVALGYGIAMTSGATVTRQMLPWVAGRGLGLAAYGALWLLTMTGIWLRHPARLRLARPHPMTLLWVHATAAAATLVLVAGHIVALALDRFAGVGWAGAFVPGQATYRPLAVAVGIVGLYVGILAGASVALAGRLVGRHWLRVHRFASVAFVLIWCHALFAGSDSLRLMPAYVATGLAVSALVLSRLAMRGWTPGHEVGA